MIPAAFPFLALPLEQQFQVILQGPLRPPSATTRRLGPADTLALHMTELERARPAAGTGGAAAHPQVVGHLAPMTGHGYPAAMTGSPFFAAVPPAGPFLTMWNPTGRDGSGAPPTAPPMAAAPNARTPWH